MLHVLRKDMIPSVRNKNYLTLDKTMTTLPDLSFGQAGSQVSRDPPQTARDRSPVTQSQEKCIPRNSMLPSDTKLVRALADTVQIHKNNGKTSSN